MIYTAFILLISNALFPTILYHPTQVYKYQTIGGECGNDGVELLF